jgi:hypothetical protein
VKVFLSYAVGSLDAAIPARLRAVAAAYDIAVLLPERTQLHVSELSADTVKKIAQCDAVIALETRTAQPHDMNSLNLEVNTAAELKKPVITLIEQGMHSYFPPSFPPNSHVIYFNRLDPTAHESSLLQVLTAMRNEILHKQDLTTLGWIAGIALGLVALGALLAEEK